MQKGKEQMKGATKRIKKEPSPAVPTPLFASARSEYDHQALITVPQADNSWLSNASFQVQSKQFEAIQTPQVPQRLGVDDLFSESSSSDEEEGEQIKKEKRKKEKKRKKKERNKKKRRKTERGEQLVKEEPEPDEDEEEELSEDSEMGELPVELLHALKGEDKKTDQEKIIALERKLVVDEEKQRTATTAWLRESEDAEKRKEEQAFFLDSRGDANNAVFEQLYRLDVPAYKRVQSSTVLLGTDLDPAVTRDILLVRGPGEPVAFMVGHMQCFRRSHRYFAEKYVVRNRNRSVKYILAPDRPNEEVWKSQASYVRLPKTTQGKESKQYGLTWEERLAQLNKVFNVRTRETPRDVNLWLHYLEFQDEMLELSKGARAPLLEVKLAVLERALEQNPSEDRLLLPYLRTAQRVLEGERALEVWKQVLARHTHSPRLYRAYLSMRQSQFAEFSVRVGLALHLSAFNGLLEERDRAARAAPSTAGPAVLALEQNMLSVWYDAMRFLMQAGHTPRAVACAQALIEYNVFAPPGLQGEDALNDCFEAYWDSDTPRVGEQHTLTWSGWYTSALQSKPSGLSNKKSKILFDQPEDLEAVAPPAGSTMELSADAKETEMGRWLVNENIQDCANWQPLRSLSENDMADADESELERVVLLEDIRDLGRWSLFSTVLKPELFLLLGKLLGAGPHVTASAERWGSRHPVMEASVHHLERFESLGTGALPALFPQDPPGRLSAPRLAFLRRAFRAGLQAFPNSLPLQDGLMQLVAQTAEADPRRQLSKARAKLARKAAKDLLAKDQANLKLWTALARLEAQAGKHTESCRILISALQIAPRLTASPSPSPFPSPLASPSPPPVHPQVPFLYWTLAQLEMQLELEAEEGGAADTDKKRSGAEKKGSDAEQKGSDTDIKGSSDARPGSAKKRQRRHADGPCSPALLQGRMFHTLCAASSPQAAFVPWTGPKPVPAATLIAVRKRFQTLLQTPPHSTQGALSWHPPPPEACSGCALPLSPLASLAMCYVYFEYVLGGLSAAEQAFRHYIWPSIGPQGPVYPLSPAHEHLVELHLSFLHNHAKRFFLPPAMLREALTAALSVFPGNEKFLSILLSAEAQSSLLTDARRRFDLLLNPRPSQLLSGASLEVYPLIYFYAIFWELPRRSRPRILALFESALSNLNSEVGHNAALWRLYLRYLLSVRDFSTAEKVYLRAVHACPGSKRLWLDGIAWLLPYWMRPGGTGEKQAVDIVNLMLEKELRTSLSFHHTLAPIKDTEDEAEEEQERKTEQKSSSPPAPSPQAAEQSVSNAEDEEDGMSRKAEFAKSSRSAALQFLQQLSLSAQQAAARDRERPQPG